jgi:2-polyprenyl-3-methyl-5-hydroxy-6-metoxy-1,4-benzoquinol methylase
MESSDVFADVPIERVRDFWNSRPCNIRHSSKTVGTREYFDEVERRKYFVEPHILQFADFPKWAGRRVLEIGCGIGTDTVSFARAGARVTAVELSEESAALARTRLSAYGLTDRVTIHVGNAEALPQVVPPQPYDLVYSFGVIHHSPNPRRIVEHLRAYMTRDSELRLMVYSRVSYKLFAIMKEEGIWDLARIDELIARKSEAQTGCPVTYTYNDETARQLLSGFTILEMRKTHIFTWDIAAYRRYEYRKAPEWAHVSDAELAGLERELGWHLLIRASVGLKGHGCPSSNQQETTLDVSAINKPAVFAHRYPAVSATDE